MLKNNLASVRPNDLRLLYHVYRRFLGFTLVALRNLSLHYEIPVLDPQLFPRLRCLHYWGSLLAKFHSIFGKGRRRGGIRL